MKIISYNISDCKQWKVDQLIAMDADVFVVPEIGCNEHISLPNNYKMEWKGLEWEYNGKGKSKGLGIVFKKDAGSIPSWYNKELTYAIPLEINDIIILAFWPTKKRDERPQKSYPQIAQEILVYYAPYLKGKNIVIVGDYNCFVGQKDGAKRYGDMIHVDEVLKTMGLRSLYHSITKEQLGKESKSTYYHTFHPNEPFFLDYAYTNIDRASYKLFDWDAKMSDHVGQEIYIEHQ